VLLEGRATGAPFVVLGGDVPELAASWAVKSGTLARQGAVLTLPRPGCKTSDGGYPFRRYRFGRLVGSTVSASRPAQRTVDVEAFFR
jgi:hypothetical protein